MNTLPFVDSSLLQELYANSVIQRFKANEILMNPGDLVTNIPLQTLGKSFGKIKKDKPVITCCASGMRSAAAKGILKSAGYSDVYNGGGWSRLQKKL